MLFKTSNLVEEYNGTSWSAQNTSPVSIKQAGSCGVQTATLIFGGNPSVNTTQLYDGTNWTDLDTVTNQPPSIYGDVHSIDSPASYLYYQLFVVTIVDTSADRLRLGEWQLWGDA